MQPERHCRVHGSPPLDAVLVRLSPGNNLTTSFCKIYFNIVLPSSPPFYKFSVLFSLFIFICRAFYVPRPFHVLLRNLRCLDLAKVYVQSR